MHGKLLAQAVREEAFAKEERTFLAAVATVLATAHARQRAEQRMRHQALHDPLTGLRTVRCAEIGSRTRSSTSSGPDAARP